MTQPARPVTTRNEKSWLETMRLSPYHQVSLLVDMPPRVIMNNLVAKGLAEDIMGTFWKITPAGLSHLKDGT